MIGAALVVSAVGLAVTVLRPAPEAVQADPVVDQAPNAQPAYSEAA
jgi:hypothetical protein